MKRRLFLQSLGVGVACAGYRSLQATTASPALTVGILPRRNVTTTHRLFQPLLKYLGQRLGRRVELLTARDFAQFWSAFRQQRFDLVHCNQYHYILGHRLFGYEAILRNQEFGESALAGALVVRRERGFQEIADLRNRTVLFGGGPRAMQSYIAPTWLLRQAGLQPGEYQERIAVNPPNAAISTYLGRADAAGIGDVVIRLDAVKQVIDVTRLHYLARTEPMAHLPWAVHPRLDPETRDSIQSLLAGLHQDPAGQTLLDTARLSGLVATLDSDYDPHRQMVREVYGADLGLERWGQA